MSAASSAQLEIWLADRCEPESGRYNIPLCLEFTPRLDEQALRAALADVLERHPAPAGRFETAQGTLSRVAQPAAVVPLRIVERAGRYDRESALEDAAGAAARPLDPGTAPLLRAEVLRHDDGALVTLTVHHIVADGRSVEVLAEDLVTAYRARAAGRYPGFAPVPVPAPLPVATAPDPYWTRLLEGEPALLAPLPDLVRGEDGLRGQAGFCERELPVERLAKVRALAAAGGFSPAVALLSVWSLLLHAWSGEEDGLLGMPFAGRDEDTQDAVGLFTRVLPVRSVCVPERPFADHAAVLGDQVLASMEAHAEAGDLPPGTAPVFSAVFLHQPRRSASWQLPDAEVRLLHPHSAVAKYDLAFAAVEGDDGLVLRIDYDRALYTPATAQLMVEQVDALLQAASSRPDGTCRDLLASLAAPHADAAAAGPESAPHTDAPGSVPGAAPCSSREAGSTSGAGAAGSVAGAGNTAGATIPAGAGSGVS
ncbi:condensation domain-containing protein, partial [Streptomyces sp. NPDC054847]